MQQAQECRKYQWCNYAWFDYYHEGLGHRDGQCYLTGTCNRRKNGKLGALFKKVCPKTPEMPRTMHAKWPCDPKDKCAEFAKYWSGDGICDMETCGNCDGSYVGDVFDGNDCKGIETGIGDESAVGLACFDDDLTLRRLTGQSCASFSFGCGLPLQANHHIWLVREICPRSCGMCSDKETVQGPTNENQALREQNAALMLQIEQAIGESALAGRKKRKKRRKKRKNKKESESESESIECPEVMCRMHCENGYVTDEDG